MSGTIQLLFKNEVVQQHRYECKSEMNDLLKKWEKWYGPMFKKIIINNIPDPVQEKPATPQFKKGSLQKTFKKPTFSKANYTPFSER